MTALLARWRAIPSAERAALPRAALVAVFVEVGLRAVSLPRLCRWLRLELSRDAPVGPPVAEGLSASGAVEWRAVTRLLRHWPGGDTCLRRSLVAGRLLRALHPVLRIGVDRNGEPIRAHAWLEIAGQPVGELPGPFLPLHGSVR
jgi:hypothetical protein